MFRVIFRKQIHGSFSAVSSQDIWLCVDAELPFAPSPGMRFLRAGAEEKATEVYWDMDAGLFVVYTERDEEIYIAKLHHRPHRAVRDVAKEYLDSGFGWRIDS